MEEETMDTTLYYDSDILLLYNMNDILNICILITNYNLCATNEILNCILLFMNLISVNAI